MRYKGACSFSTSSCAPALLHDSSRGREEPASGCNPCRTRRSGPEVAAAAAAAATVPGSAAAVAAGAADTVPNVWVWTFLPSPADRAAASASAREPFPAAALEEKRFEWGGRQGQQRAWRGVTGEHEGSSTCGGGGGSSSGGSGSGSSGSDRRSGGSGCGSGDGNTWGGRWAGRGSNGNSSGNGSSSGSSGGGGRGGGCSSRAMLLASLTTSAVAAARPTGGGGSGGGGGAAGGAGGGVGGAMSLRGFNLPQISIMSLPGTGAFIEEQELAAELLDYHTAKHGGFPRPCPACRSADFMVTSTSASASASSASSTSSTSAAAASGGGGSGGDAEGAVVQWRSRPLRCETCGTWVHMGCAGIQVVERAPPRPWFHSPECRHTYLRLEAAAARNPHPSSASPSAQLFLLTPADSQRHATLNAAGAAALLEDLDGDGSDGGGGGGGDAARMAAAAAAGLDLAVGGKPRGPVGAVLPLLAQGFNADALQGVWQAAREYDGGKYSAVLVAERQPVAAATFNVWGAEAQLCLLATAAAARRKGYAAALVADLESTLAPLGVQRLLVQARGAALPLWLGPRFGFSLVEPEEAEELHRRLPIAYYDCALLEKRL